MKRNKQLYFVGNAHIDPIWQWEWQEGSAEAKATIRSALDRMKEYPEFKFVCSASCVFEWLEEFDPDMFEEIKVRVKEGRFRIVGGWYIQPDCNNPSGESFARHGLYAQRYFREKLGVTAKIGYNVDSFGHCGSIPKLLQGAGMDRYLFMRPGAHEMDLPSNIFRWQSPDGSEVVACRLTRAYSTARVFIDGMDELSAFVEEMEEAANPAIPPVPFFYGVGNHGGGPTKKNIETIREFKKLYGEDKVHFSDLQDLFDALEGYRDVMPVHTDDLQHHAAGCYATVTAVKEGIRRGESELYAAEVFGHMAHAAIGKRLPDLGELEKGWKNVLFAQFHDSMGGCSIQAAHDSTVRSLDETRSIADRMTNNALQSLSWKIDSRDMSKGFPLVLFNPHPFPVTQTVRFNNHAEQLFDRDGKEIPSQLVPNLTILCRESWGDTVFTAHVPAMGYTCYYCKHVPSKMEVTGPVTYEKPPVEGNIIENESLRAVFDPKTGLLTELLNKKNGKNLLGGVGGVPVLIDEHEHDTWSHFKTYFSEEIGTMEFVDMKITDQGPVRNALRVDFRCGASTLRLKYRLDAGSDYLDVKAKLNWQETQKLLKLRFETCLQEPKVYYDIPYGNIERPCNGEEEPGQKWIAARDNTMGMAMINDGRYSFSVDGGTMNLTAIRSPYYIDHGRFHERDMTDLPVTEQGEHAFRFAIRAMEKDEPWHKLNQDAALYNRPCTLVVENCHEGVLSDEMSFLSVSAPNVLVSALKESEDHKGIVVRAWECDGTDTDVTFSGKVLPARLNAHFTPYSVKTFLYEDGKWTEVYFSEYER